MPREENKKKINYTCVYHKIREVSGQTRYLSIMTKKTPLLFFFCCLFLRRDSMLLMPFTRLLPTNATRKPT